MSRFPSASSTRYSNRTIVVSEHQIIALVEQLEHKIELLKDTHEEAKQRITALEEENAKLRNELKEQQTKARELRKKQDNSEKNAPKSEDFGKLVQNNLSSTDTNAELKRQLDEYIRELERCIAHLSSLS
ncbi:med21 domain-containing protein [Spirosoma montaniterrae]|uniref:med21 domain-containing protein n=1 Tax=Spirosoma montaniterrae TaxID=1178516 RepID=UPI001E36C0F6|nr:med21 domain-containing protein [Spirosoma montaniterrae]